MKNIHEINLKKKYLIAIDLDGTLLADGGKKIHKFNINAIKKLTKLNHYCIIITGRNFYSANFIQQELNLNNILICFAGAEIYKPLNKPLNNNMLDIDNFSLIHKNWISNEEIKFILNFPLVKNNLILVCGETKHHTFMTKSKITMLSSFFLEYSNKFKIIDIEKFKEFKYVSIVLVIQKNIDVNILINELNKKLKSFFVYLINNQKIVNFKNNYYFLAFNVKNSNKGIALKMVQKYLNFKKDEVIVFGDSENDIEMFKVYYENSVVLKNAKNDVQKFAKYKTNFTNSLGGVGEYLNKLFNLKL